MDVVAKVVVGNVINRLSLIKGLKKDVESLSSSLSAIQAALEDAGSTPLNSQLLTDWIMKIEDAAIDADDVLADWLLEQENATNEENCITQVIHFILNCFDFAQIGSRGQIAQRLKSVIGRLDEIAKEKHNFHFRTSVVSSETEFTTNRESSSHSSEPEFYGRDEVLENIVIKLQSSQDDILIIPIVGFGGVGKTTLAQFAYEDERVVGSFDIRIWVYVSDRFDVKRVLKEILCSFEACNSESFNLLQSKVLESLKGKKYLLVLDDMWSENEDAWNKLRSSLTSGAKGSSIVITTRLPNVASITSNPSSSFNLGVLPDEFCWYLIQSRAFGHNSEEHHPDLVPIGVEIAKKCKGIPLAAKSLGSLLKLNANKTYWTQVRDHSIWRLDNNVGNSILPALRLSYQHLPPHLKQCFSYCSVYPKGSKMDQAKLIYAWIANGYIQSQGTHELEEVGDKMFQELLGLSFFDDIKKDKYGNIVSFKMHDLMHELACFVTKECSVTEVSGLKAIPKTIRHLAVIRDSERSSVNIDPVIASTSCFRKLIDHFIASKSSFRTLFFFEPTNFDSFEFSTTLRVLNLHDMCISTLPPSICELKHLSYLDLGYNRLSSLPETLWRLRNLRMLDLSNNPQITTLPQSIRSLENLRYLSLSGCYYLTSIPESIGNLLYVRYLDLNECKSLTVLPESICNLRNLKYLLLYNCVNLKMLVERMDGITSLRQLDIRGCSALEKMPRGLGKSVHLQSLEWFVVGREDSGCGGLNELHGMNQLRGSLLIKGLENVRYCREIEEANLIGKVFLQSLALTWGHEVVDEYIEWAGKKLLEDCLLGLPPNLKELTIKNYPGECVFWYKYDQNINKSCLTKLIISWCSKLKHVFCPRHYAISLHILDISYCAELKLEGIPFHHFISIRELKLTYLPKLIVLPPVLSCLTSLVQLEILECEFLKSLSVGLLKLGSLENLVIESCPEVEFEEDDFQHLISLRELTLQSLPKLVALPEGPKKLEELVIHSCSNLKRLPQGIKYIKTLGCLTIYDCHADLHTRCEQDKGEDWNLIAHIPQIHNELPSPGSQRSQVPI